MWVIKGEFKGVVDARSIGHLCLHRNECDRRGGEACKDIVQRSEGGLSGRHNRLAATLAPHIAPAVLGESRRDVVVVGGRDLNDPTQVLAHLRWCARVGLVAGPQLTVGVCTPRIESTLVSYSKSVSIATDL